MKGKLERAMRARQSRLDHKSLVESLHYDAERGTFSWKIYTPRNKPGDPVLLHDDKRGYELVRISGIYFRVHRLAWFYVHGVWPKDQIDHINSDKRDNRLCNLRESTQKENLWNRAEANECGYKGIYLQKQCPTPRWVARIRAHGKGIYIGCYDTPEKAHAAYCEAAKKYHGEFARFK